MITTELTSTTDTVSRAISTLPTPTMTGGGNLLQINKLDGIATYENWKFEMKMYLIHEGLWHCIAETNVDREQDQRALAKICLNVKPKLYANVRTATSAREAWKNLETLYDGKDLNRRCDLLMSMFNLKLEDYPSVEQYVTAAMSLAQMLADIEKPVDDEFLAIVLLHGLPSISKFDFMKSVLLATYDVLSSEIVKTWLLQNIAREENERTGVSLLTIDYRAQSSQSEEFICHHCNEVGHIRPNCPKFKEMKRCMDKKVKEVPLKSKEKGKNALSLIPTTAKNSQNKIAATHKHKYWGNMVVNTGENEVFQPLHNVGNPNLKQKKTKRKRRRARTRTRTRTRKKKVSFQLDAQRTTKSESNSNQPISPVNCDAKGRHSTFVQQRNCNYTENTAERLQKAARNQLTKRSTRDPSLQEIIQKQNMEVASTGKFSSECIIEHPLQNTWVLRYYEPDANKPWEKCQWEIGSFNTIEDFWILYNSMRKVSELRQGCDYSIFKYGIPPMWNDKQNMCGGRWLINLDKTQSALYLDNFWLKIVLCMIEEDFNEYSDTICGSVVTVRKKADRIGVWTSNAHCEESVMTIGRKLKEITSMTNMGYYVHKDVMITAGSLTKNISTP